MTTPGGSAEASRWAGSRACCRSQMQMRVRVRRSAVAGSACVTILGILAAGPALAQDVSLSLFLTCSGNDVSYQKTGTTLEAPSQAQVQHNHSAGLPPPAVRTSPNYGLVSSPGRMSIAVQGEVVRVRPSAGATPTFRRSSDGWYELADVSVTDHEIRGKATWGLMGKLKLVIDRRSGDVTFGDFKGACEKAADTSEARKF